ncbi:hypothetical protein G7046_g44 [Stylonectria norvegica]|nr:hypothetical protein G7046_g44 [Stylonectria norvegica]
METVPRNAETSWTRSPGLGWAFKQHEPRPPVECSTAPPTASAGPSGPSGFLGGDDIQSTDQLRYGYEPGGPWVCFREPSQLQAQRRAFLAHPSPLHATTSLASPAALFVCLIVVALSPTDRSTTFWQPEILFSTFLCYALDSPCEPRRPSRFSRYAYIRSLLHQTVYNATYHLPTALGVIWIQPLERLFFRWACYVLIQQAHLVVPDFTCSSVIDITGKVINMVSLLNSAQRLGVLFLLATTWSTLTSSIILDLCSSFNTGTTPKNISIYQTNGLCHDFCQEDYAFAITQENYCWCSNFAPAKSVQKGISSCDTTCPAYPDEYCGGPGLYGYVALDGVLPSGTKGPAEATSSTQGMTTTTTAISKVTETVQNTVTTDDSTTSTESTESSTTSKTSKTSTTTTSSSSVKTTQAPTSLIQTVTAGGTIRTVTIAPAETGTTATENSDLTVKKHGLTTGAVVGIVVGLIVAIIAATGLALFFWFRRKKQRSEQEAFQDDPSIRGSSSGMMAGGRPDMVMADGSPASPNSAGNRNSTLQIDPRMDPFKQGLYLRSASHESINTLRDDHDYSRKIQPPKVLRATNPDPTPEQ